MLNQIQKYWLRLRDEAQDHDGDEEQTPDGCTELECQLTKSDPLYDTVLQSQEPLHTQEINLDSAVLSTLRTNGVQILEPVWMGGRLTGIICICQSETTSTDPRPYRLLGHFRIASRLGNETEAIQGVEAAIRPLGLSQRQMERIKTAVGETAMNAMEHGNHYQPDRPVEIQVRASTDELVVRVTDFGGEAQIEPGELPDLDAKLAGLQSPRGWGLFLIENMVDGMKVYTDGTLHTVELTINLAQEGEA